jgi:hypothetical protein
MIKNWNELNAILNKLSEDEVKSTLLEEVAGAKRGTFVKRLHQRYCALRASRERKELKALVAGMSASNVQLDNAETMHQVSPDKIIS